MKLSYTLIIGLLSGFIGECQTPESAKLEFEVASIKAAPPASFFHAPDSGTGGPGSVDPTTFRCTSCDLSSLIMKAFSLQKYQLPGQESLPREAYAISAKIPDDATPDQFRLMLQNFLKDRFGLAWHFAQKDMQGYQLVLAKNGPRLTPSKATAATPEPDAGARHTWSEGGHAGESHGAGGWSGATDRPGLTVFNGSARYRGDRKTVQEFAQMLADQLSKPVDDRTGLSGTYDIRLTWAGETARSPDRSSSAGGFSGGGHNHGGGGGTGTPAGADSPSGPALSDALQSQLGLKLVAAAKSSARILVVDHFAKTPSAN